MSRLRICVVVGMTIVASLLMGAEGCFSNPDTVFLPGPGSFAGTLGIIPSTVTPAFVTPGVVTPVTPANPLVTPLVTPVVTPVVPLVTTGGMVGVPVTAIGPGFTG